MNALSTESIWLEDIHGGGNPVTTPYVRRHGIPYNFTHFYHKEFQKFSIIWNSWKISKNKKIRFHRLDFCIAKLGILQSVSKICHSHYLCYKESKVPDLRQNLTEYKLKNQADGGGGGMGLQEINEELSFWRFSNELAINFVKFQFNVSFSYSIYTKQVSLQGFFLSFKSFLECESEKWM